MNDVAIRPERTRPALLAELEADGLSVQSCYQCGRCSAGCPVSAFFDLLPMEVVRLSAYGREAELQASQTIWLCASCETCTTRCPNGIDIARLMDRLRQRALARGPRPAEPGVAAFHRSFLRSVRRWGRTWEVGMLAAYKTRSGDLFGDLGLGWAMFRRGKLRLLPRRIRGRRTIRALFERAGRVGEAEE